MDIIAINILLNRKPFSMSTCDGGDDRQ